MSSVVPTPESLAMDCDLKCELCQESVNYGDDYIGHLQFAHSVVQNFSVFLDNARNSLKAGEKRKASDLVTLKEESNDVTDDDELEDTRYEILVTKSFELNATVK